MPRFNSDWIDRNYRYKQVPSEDADPVFVKVGRPIIVCLCGSTRFKEAFIEANFRETMAGKIVLSVGWFSHADAEKYTPTAEEKTRLDYLHKEKIDLADEIFVLNVGGYIGDSTRGEVAHAIRKGKNVFWLEPDKIPEEFREHFTQLQGRLERKEQ